MGFDYELFVIGAGPGGLAASERAASYGARVAIAEQDLVGGACVIRGCIPERLMSFAAEFSDSSEDAAGYGWNNTPCTFNWEKFIAAKDEEIHRLSQLHNHALQSSGVQLIHGATRFVDAHTLNVAGKTITAEKILIAVGAKSIKPDIIGMEYAINSDQLFSLKQQPKHIAVIGSNYIAVKLCGIMKGLGSEVTQIIESSCVLSSFDQDICATVAEDMQQRGIKIIDHAVVKEIEKTENGLNLLLLGKIPLTLKVDAVLLANDRVPNTDNLGLEKVGLELNQGQIVVDESNRTSQSNIFAVGDCLNQLSFTPVAIAQARAFADTQFGNHHRQINYEYVPVKISSHPEAATVGLSETKARAKFGDAIICYRSQFRPLLHSLSKRNEKTLIKLVVDSNSERVLGAHMVGQGAVEIIQCLALALRLGATKKDFNETIGIHPSLAEEFFTLH